MLREKMVDGKVYRVEDSRQRVERRVQRVAGRAWVDCTA